MNDYLITDADACLSASKNRDYKERVRLRFDTIIHYLQNNKLVNRVILQPDQTTDETVKIRSSDLTEDGLALMLACYDKWLKSHDRGRSITDMSLFDKELKKIREKQVSK